MKLLFAPENEWEKFVSIEIIKLIKNTSKKKAIDLMLTGGDTANGVYRYLSSYFKELGIKINIFFTDERCLAPISENSNYYNLKKNLYNNSVPSNHRIFRIKGEENPHSEALRYSNILPKLIDLLLLSLGSGGHIASIFDIHKSNQKTEQKVNYVRAPIEPVNRISISYQVIQETKNTFLLVRGTEKGKILKKILDDRSKGIISMPASLIDKGLIIIDEEAKKQL